MTIYDSLEQFVSRFQPEDYVLGGGLAVYLHTGKERDTKDIDIIALGDIGSELYHFSVDSGIRMDVVRGLEYLRSISFTPDLLRRNTTILPFRGHDVAALSREALIVSKLACLYHSEFKQDRHILFMNTPLLRPKDVADIKNLYNTGVDDNTVRELLGFVEHLRGVNISSFYDVAQRVLLQEDLPEEIVCNAYGIGRVGSLCGRKQLDSFFTVTKQAFAGKEAGAIGLLVDQTYEPCRRSRNPLKEYKKAVRP